MVGLIVFVYFIIGVIMSAFVFKYGDVVDEFLLEKDVFIGIFFVFCAIIWPLFVILYILTQLGKFIRNYLLKK